MIPIIMTFWVGFLVCLIGAALADGSPVGAWIFAAAWMAASMIGCIVYAETDKRKRW